MHRVNKRKQYKQVSKTFTNEDTRHHNSHACFHIVYKKLREDNYYAYMTVVHCLAAILKYHISQSTSPATIVCGTILSSFIILVLLSIHIPSNRQHVFSDDCLKDKREDYQDCYMLYSVPQLYTVSADTMYLLQATLGKR